MLIRRPADITPSDITSPEHFRQRRQLLRMSGAALAGSVGITSLTASAAQALPARLSPLSTDESLTGRKAVLGYNNFYEFGTDKEDPARNAGVMQTRPWEVRVEGLVARPKTFGLEDLLKLAPLEERIYRLRCVEAWSMVVPWIGYSLSALLKQVEPLGSARYVAFASHYDPEIMTRRPILDWPYQEGLRLDEAMHPLTLLTLGVYGEVLPNQNGAPVRIVVPWKYGYKSAKSIVRIRLTESQPATAWNTAAPEEYGFYSNVNPEVDHPRWSQAKERRIGDFLKRPTQMFNGYAEQVAGLYQGMDLARFH
ncbi:MAG: protein-methionine-sulfoxide reductase catalytic subunit MsrP [Rhodocyclaceae bacterium]|nr:protein-methionine-sulfoxide reductase catalytic subunit MsrP [Rhodocyclaceae bacterium]